MSERDSPGCPNCGHPFEAHCNAAAMQACRTCGCYAYSDKAAERDSPDISDSTGKLIVDVRMGRRMHHAEFDASSHPCWFDVIVQIAMSLSDQALATIERDSPDISEAAVAELVATMQLAYGPTNGYIEKVARPIVALRAALTTAEQERDNFASTLARVDEANSRHAQELMDRPGAEYWIQRLENDAECDCAVKQPCAVAAVLRDMRTALAAAEQELDAAHAKVSDLPVRVEYLGGQRTGYVQRDSVLAILESK